MGDRRGAEQNDQRRGGSDGRALPVGTERARHAPYGLRDNGDGDELEAMQQSGAHRAAESVLSICEKHERECGRQGKAAPRRKTAKIAGPHEADGKSDLAARGARQELAEADEIGIGVFVQPAAAHDEFVTKIADVSDRPAEAGDAELEEGKQNFERRTGLPAQPRWSAR